MRRIYWQPKDRKCTSRHRCSHRRGYHEGCRARPSPWRLWAQADRGQLEAAARRLPCDQSAGGGAQGKSKFFVRGAREILKIATAAEMPQHRVDLASGVTHDQHTNSYETSHTGPTLVAGAIILRGRMIDTAGAMASDGSDDYVVLSYLLLAGRGVQRVTRAGRLSASVGASVLQSFVVKRLAQRRAQSSFQIHSSLQQLEPRGFKGCLVRPLEHPEINGRPWSASGCP
jgi:hypothetical protein